MNVAAKKNIWSLAYLIPLLILFFSGCHKNEQAQSSLEIILPENPTELERKFVAAIIESFEKSDEKNLIEASHWKKTEDGPTYRPEFYRNLIARKARSIRLDRVDPAKFTKRQEGDSWVRESLPVQWVVTVTHPAAYSYTTDLNAGLFEGTIRFTTAYVVDKDG